jgi:hypothetical protein
MIIWHGSGKLYRISKNVRRLSVGGLMKSGAGLLHFLVPAPPVRVAA